MWHLFLCCYFYSFKTIIWNKFCLIKRMKLLITTFFLILLSLNSLVAQNFELVDSKVSLYPKHYASAEDLAAQIERDFSSETDKVRAIYKWLTLNINYDIETYYKGQSRVNFSYSDKEDLRRKLTAINTHTINQTLRTNKAICEGYAQTFRKISELVSIPSLFISGYSKSTIGDIDNIPQQEDHAWNGVKINGKWFLLDATWGAGHTQGNGWVQKFDDYYFLTKPEDFALTHLPKESGYLFTDKKITTEEFYSTPIFKKAYSLNKLNLLAPLEGKILAKTNDSIAFKMGKIPQNVSLHYAYRTNMRPEKIEPKCSASSCTFKVPFILTKDTELFIIANRETALQYKIIVKN